MRMRTASCAVKVRATFLTLPNPVPAFSEGLFRKLAYHQSGSPVLPTSSLSFESQVGQRYSCPTEEIIMCIMCI
jgi:hypothetical protein